MYNARSSGDACTIMKTEMANSNIAPVGTPFVALAKHALASSPAGPLKLVRPRLNRRRSRYLRLHQDAVGKETSGERGRGARGQNILNTNKATMATESTPTV